MNDVVCYLHSRNGWDRSAIGLLGAGQRLAAELGGKLYAVVFGQRDETLVKAVAGIADLVWVADHALLAEHHPEVSLSALTQACKSLNPVVVLLGNDSGSQEMTPRLAHRLGGSGTGDAVVLNVVGGELHATRAVYGGKAKAVVALQRTPAVAWIRARAFAPAESKTSPCEIKELQLDLNASDNMRIVSSKSEAVVADRLEDAKFIVSGGRGLGGPEPFTQLRQLAAKFEAQMAASRAACDAGWVPASWQVGQTGKKVAPELYLAIAISGASQHLMGIADAKVICAINSDSEAPIFKHCRFGLVEDYRKVIGPLTEKLASLLA